MSNRTETCTAQERRLLDLMWAAMPANVDATINGATLRLEDWPIGHGNGHAFAEAFYAARRARD